MEKIKKQKSKKRIILIVVLLVIVVIGGGIGYVVHQTKQALNDLTNSTETAEVTTRSLTKSVGATGKVVSLDKKDVTVDLTGVKVSELNVEVGSEVKKGDVIATFDTSDIEENLADVKTQYNATVAGNSLSSESQNLSASDTERAMQSKVDAAYEAWQNAIDNETDAKKELSLANEALSLYADASTQYYYQTKVDAAKKAYDAAKKNTENAEESYNNALLDQKSSLASSENQKKSTQLSQSTSTLTYKNQMKTYEEQIENGTLYAPMSGIITAVGVSEGSTYAGGTVVTIQDTSSYEIETEIGEYDISDVKVGQKVLIKTNATGDEQMTGKVVKVSPVATSAAVGSSNTSVTYTVRISIDNPSDRLRLDMTASLSIIMDEHENAMTVPYNAINTDENGSYVTVVSDDVNASGDDVESQAAALGAAVEGKKVYVEIVMESNYYTEIRSDELKEGDIVLTSVDSTLDLMSEIMGGY